MSLLDGVCTGDRVVQNKDLIVTVAEVMERPELFPLLTIDQQLAYAEQIKSAALAAKAAQAKNPMEYHSIHEFGDVLARALDTGITATKAAEAVGIDKRIATIPMSKKMIECVLVHLETHPTIQALTNQKRFNLKTILANRTLAGVLKIMSIITDLIRENEALAREVEELRKSLPKEAQAKAMKAQGMKIKDIADHFGVSRNTITNWVKGQ